jgi:hypothetical protein
MEPSVIWDMNRLRSSKAPTPKFFFIGDSITKTNEYMAKIKMELAIKTFKKSPKMLKYPILSILEVKNTTTTIILIIRTGWVAEIITELIRLMLDVPRIMSVLMAKITAHPKMIEFKIIFIFRIVEKPHPKMYIIEIMPIENNERNIDCFIFILRPFRELTQG